MSKGSRQRPIGVNKAIFDSNWDSIFKNRSREESGRWEHNCKHNGRSWLEKNDECKWCGAKEND